MLKAAFTSWIASFVLCLFGLSFASAANADSYIVKIRDGETIDFATVPDVHLLDEHTEGRLFEVEVTQKDPASILSHLLTHPAVEYVVPNKMLSVITPVVATTSGVAAEQWALEKVKAEGAWRLAGNKGSRRIVVAVIDTGIDSQHPSLRPNMISGYNFFDNDRDTMDRSLPGHGTHCAGIVGGTGLMPDGMSGMSPEVSIMPLRFTGVDGIGTTLSAIRAIDYAIRYKADVISASFAAMQNETQAKPMIEAVMRAGKAGIVVVSAAANMGKDNDIEGVYPANIQLPNTITVAASNDNDRRPSWSNYGRRSVSIAAPGERIFSTLPGNKYGWLSGTSMATPLISGFVALLKAQDPRLAPADIRSVMQVTGERVPIETTCRCRVDTEEAMKAVVTKRMWVSPAAWALQRGARQAFKAVNGKAPFRFRVSNAAVASIDNNGFLTANAVGETIVTVTDADGRTASSLAIQVFEKTAKGNAEPEPCPFDDARLCENVCVTVSASWCS